MIKKIVFAAVLTAMIIVFAAVLTAMMLVGCNRQIVDLTYSYNYAIIKMPDGAIVSFDNPEANRLDKAKIECWNRRSDHNGKER